MNDYEVPPSELGRASPNPVLVRKNPKPPMKTTQLVRRRLASWQLIAALALTGGAAFGASYSSYNLDSDIPGVARQTDPLLINPWGLVSGILDGLHVSDEGTGVSTLYGPNDGTLGYFTSTSGSTHSIAIPTVSGTAVPTGVADNQRSLILSSSDDFVITSGSVSGPSRFIYCTEDGLVAGYNPSVDVSAAVTGTDLSSTGAGFTGCALSLSGTSPGALSKRHHLFLADFAQDTVEVLDDTFTPVTLSDSNAFVDPDLPAAPAGYTWSPFNVHTLDYFGRAASESEPLAFRHLLIVTYALQSTSTMPLNDVPVVGGTSYGVAAIFKTDGTFLRNLSAPGQLCSPWGVAVSHHALPGFGAPIVVFIGNHGNGTISAYGIDPRFPDLTTYLGVVTKDAARDPLVFDGLWALRFGVFPVSFKDYIATDGCDLFEDTRYFFFSAGILNEEHGLVGRILYP